MEKLNDAKSMLQYQQQQQQQQQQQTLLSKAGSGVAAGATVAAESAQESWLSLHMNNNNNAVKHIGAAAAATLEQVQDEQNMWQCVSCKIVGVVEERLQDNKLDGNAVARKSHMKLAKFVIQPNSVELAAAAAAGAYSDDDDDNEQHVAATVGDGAACSLTPPGSSPHSNRTSINNSTENLSYSSDNYFADDLILIDDDDEEISLNSDDCIYAYRGEGAEFDLALDMLANRNRLPGALAASEAEDETDFLEMDFDPDPLSEVEYGNYVEKPLHMDALLVQRNTCHTSGGSATTATHHMSLQATPTQRLLFSSPINDLPAPKALQSTGQLSKDFARISLHLNEIKGAEPTDDNVVVNTAHNNAAHSLPSALTGSFNIETLNGLDTTNKISSAKVTGAKPKRINTFSTSSSSSSKNSIKSRNSLRAALTPALCSSSSFDERSVSCAEFRCAQSVDDCTPLQFNIASSGSSNINNNNNCNLDYFGNDDATCLDCIEKEFLAHTIGKSMDNSQCMKCRKRCSGNLALYARVEQSRGRSGTPTLFADGSSLFEAAAAACWPNATANLLVRNLSAVEAADNVCDISETLLKFATNTAQQQKDETVTMANQCDNLQIEQPINKPAKLEQQSVTISTLNLSEDALLQALEKLQVSYCAELIKYHFSSSDNSNTIDVTKPVKQFKNLKDLLLHESKKYCNYKKLKRLIQLATRKQLQVHFEKNTEITELELVPVKVADILQQWNIDQNLTSLEQLDKRFAQANVLGKVANLVRQTQQRTPAQRRPQPEYISIPQYYSSGFLTLSKNC